MNLKTQQFVLPHKNTTYVFKSKPDGFVHCDEDGEIWCDHIKLALVKHIDQEVIFEPYVKQLIMVPMVPTKKIWLKMEAVEWREPIYKIFFTPPQSDADAFLGFLHPGEGRIILRTMMWDWFQSHVALEGLFCHAKGHGFKAEMNWQRDMKDPSKKLLQYYSVWQNKTCLSCLISGEDDWDDVIPETTKGSSVF